MTPSTLPADVDELLIDVTERRPLRTDDGRSGAVLERVVLAERAHVLKHVGGAGDWVSRASGDLDCRAVRVWTSGLLDALPGCIDHAVEAAAYGAAPRQGAVLQRDVGTRLLPAGDHQLRPEQHRRFIDHMADLHAGFWNPPERPGEPGSRDRDDALLPLEDRYLLLSPHVIEAEREHGPLPDPLPMVPDGWRQLARIAPGAARTVAAVHGDPSLLVEPLRRTPWTLLHGDWKAGNLGVHPDGRTILLDWSLPGRGPGCADLTWYLAINAARSPERKETTVARYRRALERRGIDTTGWWDQQLALSLIGTFAVLGWEKALGDPAELRWWVARVEAAARWLFR